MCVKITLLRFIPKTILTVFNAVYHRYRFDAYSSNSYIRGISPEACRMSEYVINLTRITRGRSLNPFPNKPWFLRVCNKSLSKTLWEKEKLLAMSNFSFSHSVFYPFGKLSGILIKFEIVVCKLFQFGRV